MKKTGKERCIVRFLDIDTAFTYLDPASELFKVVNVPLVDGMEEYVGQGEILRKGWTDSYAFIGTGASFIY